MDNCRDPTASPYTADQLERERANYTSTRTFGEVASGAPVTSTSSTWSDDEEFRTHYRDYLSSSGGTYQDYEPAYRYGNDIGRDQRYRGRVVGGHRIRCARRDWESRNPNDGWERFKAAVRRGWERTTDAVERAIPGDADRDGR